MKAGHKTAYHHGSLREALIEAAYGLISEHGVDGFTIADACRAAGVSTAAPYRHFADRDALIRAVCVRGYERLGEQIVQARGTRPLGSPDAIIAMGQAYVAFVVAAPNLFEIMWGAHDEDAKDPQAQMAGEQCFGALCRSVEAFKAENGLDAVDTMDIAVPLWTMVHGTASLHLGERLGKMAPDTDVNSMIDATVRAYLRGLTVEFGG
jgi:AcrR family transcriptional regulator